MTKRIIPRLEIKSRKLIKGIRMEGLRVVGDHVEKKLLNIIMMGLMRLYMKISLLPSMIENMIMTL